jgi:hypothetical protein
LGTWAASTTRSSNPPSSQPVFFPPSPVYLQPAFSNSPFHVAGPSSSAAPVSCTIALSGPGTRLYGYGACKRECLQSPRFQCGCQQLLCLRPRSLSRMELREEVVTLIGVWQMGESKRNPQESEAHSMILLTAGSLENEDVR